MGITHVDHVYRKVALGLVCFGMSVAAAIDPAGLPRMEICLNGAWDTVLDAGGEKIPAEGWSPRRAPAMPITTRPPAVSVWYKQSFRIPRQWVKPDRRFFLKLDQAGHYAAIYWNGRLTGEHYGQFTPFEADVTSAVRAGEANAVAIFVHNASGKYVRPGANLTDPMEGNAYRGATDNPVQRNWVGIAGDILLSWRPAAHIADVVVIPSVRKKRLEARVETAGASGLTLRAAVADGEKVVLRLPEKPAGDVTLAADWSNPVLWGTGLPKLYLLRTELLKQGKVIDRNFTRFGFREVWVSGKDVLLNGKKVWMAGTYFPKLAPIRYLNDRRPQSLMLDVMQASGLNAIHAHWDGLGEPWLNLCDEKGILVLAGFYCDGRPQIQSKADDGWADWIVATGRQWVRTVRNHPSIIVWRPTDSVMPQNVNNSEVTARLMAQIRQEDVTRPFAVENEESEITAWWQSPLKDPRNSKEYDDASRMAEKLASSTKPLLTKEIYAGFQDVDNLSRFFRIFYEKSYAGGGTGIIVQHLPLIQSDSPFRIEWLSDSGRGNRDTGPFPPMSLAALPNWCDPAEPAWTPSPYSKLFADLYKKFVGQVVASAPAAGSPELLVSGLAPDEIAILLPRDPQFGEATGTRAAADGKAWIDAPQPGAYRLFYGDKSKEIRAQAPRLPRKPGYDYIERIKLP